MKNPKVSFLMPVRNEAETLKASLGVLKKTIRFPHEVLVVFDMAEDTTIPVIAEAKRKYPEVRGVHNTLGRGVANAIRAGVRVAKGEYVMILVADDTGPIAAVGDMISLMEEGADFVSATRYAKGGKVIGGAFSERILSRMANMIFYSVAGAALTDSTVGFKMFRRSLFELISLEGKPVGWLVAFEMSIKAQLLGVRMGEVPIVSVNRPGGKGTFRLRKWVREYLRWFFWGSWKLTFSGKRRTSDKNKK